MISPTEYKKNLELAVHHLHEEYKAIRTGKATLAIFDGVSVPVYETNQPLSNLASLSIENSNSVLIAPYDTTLITTIEDVLRKMDSGVSITVADTTIRVNFPSLTGETRVLLVKRVKEKGEAARIVIRNERDKMINKLKKEKKVKEISEDEAKNFQIEIEKITKEMVHRVDDAQKEKEGVITTI